MEIDDLGNWRKTHYAEEIKPKLNGVEVILMGWLRELRIHGNLIFLILADRSGDVQIVIKEKKLFNKIKNLNREDVIAIKGIVKKSKKTVRGIEVVATELKILNKSKKPLPIEITEKTPTEFNKRFDWRVLDLRKPKNFAIFKIRAKTLEIAREFLNSQGFIEIETPKIIASATEGGASLFQVKYFERDAYLRQSPQLYKELMTSCFEKVFEIGHVFRAEHSDTLRHLAEVTQLDIEMGFATEKDTWKILERLIKMIYEGIKNMEELKKLNNTIETPKKFERKSYDEIIKILNENNVKLKYGDDLTPTAERKINELFKNPVIIYDYPINLKPFYIHPKDEKLSYGFDLMMGGIEIASGGRRIHNSELYVEMLKKKGLNIKKFKNIVKFYEYGMPPHAGWAIGIDRLLMILTGCKNIREVVLFPRDLKRLEP